MKINDVEKLTGLTAKSIRYYESKGLITVQHNKENGYRIYTEEDVLHLKRIKVLRYLDFSIEEIRCIQEQELPEIQRTLQRQAEQFESLSDTCDLKKSLCISLSKDYDMKNRMVREYDEAIEFLKGKEFEEVQESLRELACPSLPQMIVCTLVLGAPVLGLFLNIQMHSGNKEILIMNAVFALIGAVWISLQWRDYFQRRKYQKERMKEKGKQDVWVVLAIIPVLIGMFTVLVLIDRLVISLFAPRDWLFYEFQGGGDILLILIAELPLFGAIVYLIERIRHVLKEKSSDLAVLFEILWNHKMIFFVVWCALFYFAVVNVAFVTPETIVSYSTLHPAGVTYEYKDISRVDTSFGWKNIDVREYKKKGTFSYRISIGEKKLVFSQPSINESIERYVEDTYLELEEFDVRVMSLGVPKKGSAKYSDRCDLDQVYVNRFLRIIENGN